MTGVQTCALPILLSEIEQVADRIAIMANGVIGYEGAREDFENLEELFFKTAERYMGGGQDAAFV